MVPSDRKKLYWERVCSDKVRVSECSVEACSYRIAHTAAYRQNDVDLMSCKGSSWTCISNLTLIKCCVQQKAYSKCIYGLSSCLKSINEFHLTQTVGGGGKMLYIFLSYQIHVFLVRIIQQRAAKWKKKKVFQVILRALI